jgi:hypothetical protein
MRVPRLAWFTVGPTFAHAQAIVEQADDRLQTLHTVAHPARNLPSPLDLLRPGRERLGVCFVRSKIGTVGDRTRCGTDRVAKR